MPKLDHIVLEVSDMDYGYSFAHPKLKSTEFQLFQQLNRARVKRNITDKFYIK